MNRSLWKYVKINFENGRQVGSACSKYCGFAREGAPGAQVLVVEGLQNNDYRIMNNDFTGDDLNILAATFREAKRLDMTKIW